MELISRGGYSEVFYDREKGEIYRRSPKYFLEETESFIEPSSITDLIFTKSLENSAHTPVIHTIDTSGEYISFRMPHYGKSLHHWINEFPSSLRKKYAVHVLLQVVATCMYFEKNAFLHPDLKPSNIMIETNADGSECPLYARIIDFNTSTVRIIDEKNRNIHWANAIGTWNYCAPEIVLHETPDWNSIPWTIGVIATSIIDQYAFSEFVGEEIQHKLAPQKTWQKIFRELYDLNPDHPPLLRKETYEPIWQELIWNCTHWSQNKRWGLPEIYRFIYHKLLDDGERQLYRNADEILDHIHMIEHVIYIGDLDHKHRESMIDQMFQMCMRIKRMNLFPTAVTVFDRCESIVSPENMHRMAGACLLISASLFNIDLLASRTKMTLLMKFFPEIRADEMSESIYEICSHLEWKVWEKPVHIIIDDSSRTTEYNRAFWEHVKDGFLYYRDCYTQWMVAEYVMQQCSCNRKTGT